MHAILDQLWIWSSERSSSLAEEYTGSKSMHGDLQYIRQSPSLHAYAFLMSHCSRQCDMMAFLLLHHLYGLCFANLSHTLIASQAGLKSQSEEVNRDEHADLHTHAYRERKAVRHFSLEPHETIKQLQTQIG